MIRTQIQLTEEQTERLRLEARRSGQSVAEIIRRTIDRYLADNVADFAAARSRLSALKVVGAFHSGKSDVAERHDDYLEEGYR